MEGKLRTAKKEAKNKEIDKKTEELPIVLRDEQLSHFQENLKIMEKFKFVVNNSPLGSGKTYIAMAIYKKLNFKHLIYISTGTILEKVREILTRHNIPTNNLISYESFRSKINCQPKHGYLSRSDDSKGRKTITNFTVTEKFIQLAREGVLIVSDEIQNVKNKSVQYDALCAVSKYIIDNDTCSRIVELSGLHAHKAEHFVLLLKRYRIITADKLVDNRYNEQKYLGLQELINFCKNKDPILTQEILDINSTNMRDSKKVNNLCFILYNKIVQPLITCSMGSTVSSDNVTLDIKNGYYQLNDEDNKFFQSSIRNLNSIFNVKEGFTLHKYTQSLREIEISKINLMIRIATSLLDSNPNIKVVFGLNYLKTIGLLSSSLQKYGCITLTGSVKVNVRAELITSFNEPNANFRVLIGNMRIINSGIDLDDRSGNFHRYAFGSPSYFFIESHQFAHRFLRGIDTKSSTKVRFIYGNSKLETSILNKLAESSYICKLTLKSQVDAGVKFPGSYEEEIEEKTEIPEGPYNIGEILTTLSVDTEEEEKTETKVSAKTFKGLFKTKVVKSVKVDQQNEKMNIVETPKKKQLW